MAKFKPLLYYQESCPHILISSTEDKLFGFPFFSLRMYWNTKLIESQLQTCGGGEHSKRWQSMKMEGIRTSEWQFAAQLSFSLNHPNWVKREKKRSISLKLFYWGVSFFFYSDLYINIYHLQVCSSTLNHIPVNWVKRERKKTKWPTKKSLLLSFTSHVNI